MGSACCCLRNGFGEFLYHNSSYHWNCSTCWLLQNFSQVYASLFRRGELHAIPLSMRGTTSLNPMQSRDDSLADMYRSPPIPLPYDADPRYYRLRRDGFVSRQEKGSSHSYDDTEPRTSEADDESEPMIAGSRRDDVDKYYNNAKPSSKLPMAEAKTGFAHLYDSSDDEDVCPTCLEEYTTENPRIVTKCSHDFHLGCIYEWMERSDKCPVCGKVMVFDETT